MRKLTKVVALAVTLGLLSQPMAFAQADPYVSLIDVQAQAREDASFLNEHYGLLGAAGLVSLGALFATLYITEQQREIALLKDDLAEANLNAKELHAQNQKLQRVQKKIRNKALQEGREATRERAAKKATKELEKVYEQRIAQLNKQLADLQHRFTTNPTNVLLKTGEKEFNMKPYKALLERETSEETRAALLAKMKKEPWYTALSAEEKNFFDGQLTYIMAVFRHQGIEKELQQTAVYTFEHAATYRLRPGLRPIRQLLHEVAYKGAKPLAVTILLFGGLAAAHAATSGDAEVAKKAARIDANFNLFLNATPKQIAQMQTEMQKHPFLKDVILDNAAALYSIAHSEDASLLYLRKTLKTNMGTTNMRSTIQGTKKAAR